MHVSRKCFSHQVEDKVAEENKKNEQNSEEANKENHAKIDTEAKPVISNDKMELKYKYREGTSLTS